jgi:hypothetical protein
MRSNESRAVLKYAVLAAILLLGAGASLAQTVNLTAGPTSITLPDGNTVPMWGFTCGAPTGAAVCAASNPNAGAGWSPILITVPPGNLTINLTNALPTPPGATTGIPTSLMIVGQLGAGLGDRTQRTTSPSPDHSKAQGVTWPTAGTGAQFIPPTQADRVQSFATEVATTGSGTPTALVWTNLKPGTYLIESGTHPSIQVPMGLYGILVVTTAPSGATAGTAYPAVGTTAAVTYDADVPLILGEIDALQNQAVNTAVNSAGFSESTVWSGQPNQCGNPASSNFGSCYPPAVNYDPRYYLVNGVAFDSTALANSIIKVPATATTGNVLVRFVNAGLRMHVPSIVGAQVLPSGSSTRVAGFALIAEDGNLLPGLPRLQNEVFLAAGKTYDVMLNPAQSIAGTFDNVTYPVFDRQLSLSTNNSRDGGMHAYVQVGTGGSTLGTGGSSPTAVAASYYCTPGVTLSVLDASKGVLGGLGPGAYGAALDPSSPAAVNGTITLNPDGTFIYKQPATNATCGDKFVYNVNGKSSNNATVTIAQCGSGMACYGGAPVANNDTYTSAVASRLQVGAPGVLENDTDPAGHPLTASLVASSVTGGTVTLNADGSFTAIPATPPTGSATTSVTFQYNAVNSQKASSAAPASVTVSFNGGSGLQVNVYDAPSALPGNTPVLITDYRWIIEEDRTFHVDPNQENTGTAIGSIGTNFHTSHMPLIASGCMGTAACESGQTVFDPKTSTHLPAVCDIGDGVCRTDAGQQVAVDPGQVHLDPTKRYYISILPGDAGNTFTKNGGAAVVTNPKTGAKRQFSIEQDCPSGPGGSDFAPGSGTCGHSMGGAPIGPGQSAVTVLLQETPFQSSKISVFVFEDDSPLNGEQDASGGIDTLAPIEPGLGNFQIRLFDDAGSTADATGQMTYDMFNMPLSNSLAGTIDPTTSQDACPISVASTDGLVGMIVTCPKYEADGKTLSPLAGQAVIANMMPGRYGVVANPSADRIARGEEWLQTNTLDGQKAHDSFIKVGGPAYFQEFGPAGFHVTIGFANPAIINARLKPECDSLPAGSCNNTVTGTISDMRQSRSPDQRLYGSGTHDAYGFTQCFVSLGDPDGPDIAFTKCDAKGKFTLSGIPNGSWRITVFDQWNDQIVDGLSTPVKLTGSGYDFGQFPVQQWHTNVSTSTFLDQNGDGVRDNNEAGLPLVATNIRFRDGSFSNFNNTDLNGNAQFNEEFPLFNWYVIEADTTRYKQTGVHVVYDAGGPADGTPGGANSTIAANLANTIERNHLPTNLRVPGAVYCDNADCNGFSIQNGPDSSAANPSTGRIDPPWASTEGWQGFIGQYEFLEFGEKPFAAGENGGIQGEVIYASTRPFDDPSMLIHTSWTPNVPGVTVNLYQEGTAPDGTSSLKLVDTTKTSSWDDWAQGFRADGIPNMNCPGEGDGSSDLFFFTLENTTNWLNPNTKLPNNSRFKCYDGLHNFNQVQPAPYDGMYKFPSVTSMDLKTGKPTGTNCTICSANPTGDGTKMLPSGKYVVEMIVPPGYELVKEEDKNILIGDNYIAPVTQQFGGIGNIFILPDQAEVNSQYNANNAQNMTNNLGSTPRTEGDTGSVEEKWPCVGQSRIVPDFISLFPYAKQVSPFAGATRNLCDRKEVTLDDQRSVRAKFWVFSSTHVAARFTGFILDDLSSEFDPFSPQFGEKFAVPNLPISIKDFAGNEVLRTYSDQWGQYSGLNYSTWEVNPPNPTGYAPTMMVACMNDPGNGPTPDPFYNPAYSQFCYEIPYMPGKTQYMDTPVVPTASFAEGYNPPDCAYPDATPAIKSVIGNDATGAVPGSSGIGPWVSSSGIGHTLTITALGDKQVPNPAYTGPQATAAPYNQKFLTRHYGFGNTQGSGSVAIIGSGGIPHYLTTVSWSDSTITGTVPDGVPSCATEGSPLQINSFSDHDYSTYSEKCGQLVIVANNGKTSIDAITVTIGGKAPTYVNGENASKNAIQTAIDNANPGDLIIVAPGTYHEMVLMWKPVRLQGVGSGSVTINANTHPSGKADPWRRQVSCLFGLALDGSLLSKGNPYDSTGKYTCRGGAQADPLRMQAASDPLPKEGVIGWDTTLNGNLAQLLQEPTLMGAYEGAGITVLAKGQNLSIDGNATAEGDFPAGSRALTNNFKDCRDFPSNFLCNPSRIDGFTVTNSSQGGGGIYAHGWNHYLEVSNNRVYGNAGTLSGGITIGQGESPDAILGPDQVQLPFLFEMHTRVHNNAITSNASYGDELFSATPSAAGGITFCTGADYYHFNFNWVCGNLTTGDGAGLVHEGFIYNGDISHNWILFNQSNNISIPANGGGIAILGASPDGTTPNGLECGNTIADADCIPGLSDGTGPGLVIHSNLIMGNTAESGSGGGMRLQTVNGTEVARFPHNPERWYGVNIFNNIIANNVAGWDGGGVSLQDALKVNFINNTVVSNDTTASAGALFNALAAPLASTPPPGCTDGKGNPIVCTSPQPAGLVTMQNTVNLTSSLPKNGVTCPEEHPNCTSVSYPKLENNLFWQNRAFNIHVGGRGQGTLSQQNIVVLVPELNQSKTGQCVDGASYWDIGVRGDTKAADHSSGITLTPTYSILTDITGYSGGNNKAANPNVVSQYCNGSRVPPELGKAGYFVPPGIADATVPNPTFNITAAATVDEGNNWINMVYGPLTLPNPTLTPNVPGYGNYAITSNSKAAIDAIPAGTPNFLDAPRVDYFGAPRKMDGAVDIGAVEFVPPAGTITYSSGDFGNVSLGAKKQLGIVASVTNFPVDFTFSALPATANGRFSIVTDGCAGTTVNPGSTCTITVQFAPGNSAGPATGTLQVSDDGTNSPQFVSLTGTGVQGNASASPNPVAFGAIRFGTPGSQTVTVTNNGPGTLTITTDTVNGNNFTKGADNCAGKQIQSNGICTIVVNFLPTAGNANQGSISRAGTLTINSNGTTPATTVNLSGTGVQAVVALTGPGSALTSGPATTTIKKGLITVSNTGGSALTFAATNPFVVTKGGTAGGTFKLIAPASGTPCVANGKVLAGATCTIGVQYTPGNSTATATAHIVLNDSGAATTSQTGNNFNAN